MKKSSRIFIFASLILCLSILCSCNASFVGNEYSTDSSNIYPSDSATVSPSGEPALDSATSVFDGNGSASAGNGISKDRLTTSADSQNHKSEDEILASEKFVVKGRIESDGSIMPYQLARSGDNISLVTTMEGLQIGFISTDTTMYVFSPSEKKYSEVPSLMQKYIKNELEGMASASDRKFVSEGTEEVDGTTLNYKKYDDGSVDYSYNGTLVKQVSYDKDGKKSVLYIDEVSENVSESSFSAPSSYKLVSITEFMKSFAK